MVNIILIHNLEYMCDQDTNFRKLVICIYKHATYVPIFARKADVVFLRAFLLSKFLLCLLTKLKYLTIGYGKVFKRSGKAERFYILPKVPYS